MSIIDTLITDRTQQNVQEWERLRTKGLAGMTADELARWLAGVKGGYSPHIDMNRVGEAMTYIAATLNGYGYITQVSPKIWSNGEIPNAEQLEHYLEDIRTLRAALTVLPTTPAVPADMEGLTVEKANAIEQILVDLDAQLRTMAATFVPCGDAFCGGDYL